MRRVAPPQPPPTCGCEPRASSAPALRPLIKSRRSADALAVRVARPLVLTNGRAGARAGELAPPSARSSSDSSGGASADQLTAPDKVAAIDSQTQSWAAVYRPESGVAVSVRPRRSTRTSPDPGWLLRQWRASALVARRPVTRAASSRPAQTTAAITRPWSSDDAGEHLHRSPHYRSERIAAIRTCS